MSLEQMRGAPDIDARTDVYAFGVVLYEGLTGARPYQADNYFEYCTKLTTTEPIAPKALRADIPWSLSRLVLWTLEKDRDQRVAAMPTFQLYFEDNLLAGNANGMLDVRGYKRTASPVMGTTLPIQPPPWPAGLEHQQWRYVPATSAVLPWTASSSWYSWH
jgi:serine/threonine-protein kinase